MMIFAIILGASSVSDVTSALIERADCLISHLDTQHAQSVASAGGVFVDTGQIAPDLEASFAAAPACMAEYHWSANQVTLDARYTLARLGLPSAEEVLRKRGIDPAQLAAAYRSLPAARRAHILERGDIVTIMSSIEKIVPTDADLPAAGRYIGFLNIIEAIPLQLS